MRQLVAYKWKWEKDYMNELVSVVVPIYEQADYLQVCLASIANQSYENLEVLLIDDGSENEEIKEVCDSFCEKDARFIYKNVEHKGVSAARNEGVKLSTGKYLIFVDSDDTLYKDRIQKCVTALEDAKELGKRCCFVLNGIEWIDESAIVSSKMALFEDRPLLFSFEQNEFVLILWKELFNFVTNKMYKLDVIRKSKISFEENMNIAEDLVFNIEYMKADDGDILVVNEPLYRYIHRNENRLSLLYSSNALKNTKRAYAQLMRFAMGLGISSEHKVVICSEFLYNWTARLSAIYKSDSISKKNRKKLVNTEVRSEEFQNLLILCWRNKKISTIRYITLRTRNFFFYFLLRKKYLKTIKSFLKSRGR